MLSYGTHWHVLDCVCYNRGNAKTEWIFCCSNVTMRATTFNRLSGWVYGFVDFIMGLWPSSAFYACFSHNRTASFWNIRYHNWYYSSLYDNLLPPACVLDQRCTRRCNEAWVFKDTMIAIICVVHILINSVLYKLYARSAAARSAFGPALLDPVW